MPQANPYDAYQKTSINTADQRRLIVMLYDGAIRYMRKGALKIEAKDFEGAHNYLVRSREVIAELLSTLRPEKGGEVGANLKKLYVYVFNRLVEANLLKDVEILQETISIMETLREGWSGIKSTETQSTLEGEEARKVNVTM